MTDVRKDSYQDGTELSAADEELLREPTGHGLKLILHIRVVLHH
jgi:hypothetical protein